MALQLVSPVTVARTVLNDPDAVRYSATDLLQYANEALDQIVGLVPELFVTDGTHTCTAGVDQTLTHNTAISLYNVHRVQGGEVVTKCDLTILDQLDPAWRSAAGAPTKHWSMKHLGPLKFMVYPPAPVNQVLEVSYVKVPAEYGLNDDTGLPANLADAISDYVIYRAESRDDEHVNSERAAQFMASFVKKVKG